MRFIKPLDIIRNGKWASGLTDLEQLMCCSKPAVRQYEAKSQFWVEVRTNYGVMIRKLRYKSSEQVAPQAPRPHTALVMTKFRVSL